MTKLLKINLINKNYYKIFKLIQILKVIINNKIKYKMFLSIINFNKVINLQKIYLIYFQVQIYKTFLVKNNKLINKGNLNYQFRYKKLIVVI